VKGCGIALLPVFIAEQELASGTLRRIMADYAAPALALYAIYPPTRHLAVKVRLFIDFLVERLGSAAA
jgi:DNA-binding transcriptional LysR family regulator